MHNKVRQITGTDIAMAVTYSEAMKAVDDLSPEAQEVAQLIIAHLPSCQYAEQLQAFAEPLLLALASSPQTQRQLK